MQIRHKYFPYPVVAEANPSYENTSFLTDADVEKDGYNLRFTLKATIDNEEINTLIKQKAIAFVHHIECPQTCFRQVIRTDDSELQYTIHESKLNGVVQVCSLIVATADIKAYKNRSFSADYKGFSFSIDNGCILGIGNQINLRINKEKDDLESTDSIFTVVPLLDQNETYVKVNTSNTRKIEIKVPQETWNRYQAMSMISALESTMHAMLIIPALMCVFDEILRNADELYLFEDYRWFRALKVVCKKHGVDFDNDEFGTINSFELAQKILDTPIIRAIEFLSNNSGGEE